MYGVDSLCVVGNVIAVVKKIGKMVGVKNSSLVLPLSVFMC